jgi:sugar/nucleoside kinase (ribokinase family)
MNRKHIPLLAVGTVATDDVETPFGRRERCFGGSASFFSCAASFFTPVKLNAVVGEDFPPEYRRILEERGIDLSSLEVKRGGKTFHWKGSYEYDMNTAHTRETQLNVLAEFDPVLPPEDDYEFVFLANVDPVIQQKVLAQVPKKTLKWSAADTMNFWITHKPAELKKVLSAVHMLVLNDGEARQLTQEPNLIKAARRIQGMGPGVVVIKKGEHGALLFHGESFFAVPAYPCETVFDPTGAGDSFAGGLMGYLVKTGDLGFENFKRAVAHGCVVASFAVEDFSMDRLRRLTLEEIEERFEVFQKMMRF